MNTKHFMKNMWWCYSMVELFIPLFYFLNFLDLRLFLFCFCCILGDLEVLGIYFLYWAQGYFLLFWLANQFLNKIITIKPFSLVRTLTIMWGFFKKMLLIKKI